MAEGLAAAFVRETREHWAGDFAEIDACVTPVLTIEKATAHPQMAQAFRAMDGIVHPRPPQ